jgi:hypothetical protein
VAYLTLHAGKLKDRLASDLAWAIAGFALICALGALGYLLCCGTADFIRPTWDAMFWRQSPRPYSRIFSGFHYAYLPLVLGVALGLSASSGGRPDRTFAAGAVYFIAVVAFASWLQFASGILILNLFYYFAFLIPPFLVCAALTAVRLCGAAGGASRGKWLLASTAAVLLLPLLHVHGGLSFATISLPRYLAIMAIILATIAMRRRGRVLIGLESAFPFSPASARGSRATWRRTPSGRAAPPPGLAANLGRARHVSRPPGTRLGGLHLSDPPC